MKQEEPTGRRRAQAYISGMLGLTVLIAAAFFAPKIVFAVQDDMKCREVVQGQRESMDIAAFNSNYETNLYKRLLRFAEGIGEGKQYYVTVQDMEPT